MPSGANTRVSSSVSKSLPARRATAYDSSIAAKLEYSNFAPGACASDVVDSAFSSAASSSLEYGFSGS